jgi:hypothetical protein
VLPLCHVEERREERNLKLRCRLNNLATATCSMKSEPWGAAVYGWLKVCYCGSTHTLSWMYKDSYIPESEVTQIHTCRGRVLHTPGGRVGRQTPSWSRDLPAIWTCLTWQFCAICQLVPARARIPYRYDSELAPPRHKEGGCLARYGLDTPRFSTWLFGELCQWLKTPNVVRLRRVCLGY